MFGVGWNGRGSTQSGRVNGNQKSDYRICYYCLPYFVSFSIFLCLCRLVVHWENKMESESLWLSTLLVFICMLGWSCLCLYIGNGEARQGLCILLLYSIRKRARRSDILDIYTSSIHMLGSLVNFDGLWSILKDVCICSWVFLLLP